MKKQTKKLAAPIVIGAVAVGWIGGWAALCTLAPGLPLWVRLGAGAVALGLGGVTVFVLVERIKEIRSGEEDDLSKY